MRVYRDGFIVETGIGSTITGQFVRAVWQGKDRFLLLQTSEACDRPNTFSHNSHP